MTGIASLLRGLQTGQGLVRFQSPFHLTEINAENTAMPCFARAFASTTSTGKQSSKVSVRIGSPVTGYGHESRNHAAHQRIPHRIWTDVEGGEHVEVNFYVRGSHGHGKVFTEMFKDKEDKKWKFTYMIVEIDSPFPARLMLESYIPA